ncbi:MAG TPA: hypothetical protein O0X27_00010 [Methanocorpusculum sp.]|nr:hypothetical protein [Methanocorpusculum sp.]
MSASINAIAAYFKVPAVWATGLIAALGIMLVYATTTYVNVWIGIGVLLVVLNILPFFFAGIYGMILDGNTKKGAFSTYARYGYSRCLAPALFIFMICILLYVLLGPFGLIVLIPVLFFIYFADITAMRHNLKTGQAIKDSARRARNGAVLVIIFYLGNVIACFLCSLFIDIIFSFTIQAFVPANSLTSLTSLVESAAETISQNLFATNSLFATETPSANLILNLMDQLIETPGIMLALTTSLAAGALVFTPFFVAYKAYFFRDLLIAEATVAAVVKAAQERAQQMNAENPSVNAPPTTPSESPTLSPEKPALQRLIPETPKAPEKPAVPAYDPHAGEDGEYDSKGRWFKYK